MIHETCDACGFDGAMYSDAALVGTRSRRLGHQWRVLLDSAGDHVRDRPAPEVWSALEYAAHSRDITALHRFGVDFALTHDHATIAAIDGDTMIAEAAAGYADEDVSAVVTALARGPRGSRHSPPTTSTAGTAPSSSAQTRTACAGCSSTRCTTRRITSTTSSTELRELRSA